MKFVDIERIFNSAEKIQVFDLFSSFSIPIERLCSKLNYNKLKLTTSFRFSVFLYVCMYLRIDEFE